MKALVFSILFFAAGLFCIAASFYTRRKKLTANMPLPMRRLTLISSRFIFVLGLCTIIAGIAVSVFRTYTDFITLGYIGCLTLLLIVLIIFIQKDSKKER
ncbi:hypothetical protein V1L52_11975 [Treponema sp. HNW]|uniref:hypothetical protein n=1 Tax=Treponema sp. HNW TaxID=3116654 RepID=UPI003D10FFB5